MSEGMASLRELAILLSLSTLSSLGCSGGDLGEVTGRVARADNSPLVGARVVARSDATGKSVNGLTDADGRYALVAEASGTAVPTGEYKASILEFRGNGDNMRPATISPKYANFDQSGLTFTLSDGEEKVFDVVVTPP